MASATYEVPALAIALLSANDRRRAKDYQGYSLEWLPLAANGARVAQEFVVDGSHDFIGLYITGEVTDTAAPPVEQATPQFMINFKIADRSVFDKDAHWRTVVGFATGPFPIPFPLYVPRSAKLVANLSNLTATAFNVRLTIHGLILHNFAQGNRVY